MGTLWQTLKRLVWTYSMMLGSDETGQENVFSYAVNVCQSDNVRDVILRLLKWCGRLILAGMVLSCLLFSATCIYAGLYYLIMPTRIIQQSLHFDYGAHHALPNTLPPIIRYPGADTSHLPTATVSFLTSNIQWHNTPLYSSLPTMPKVKAKPGKEAIELKKHVLIPSTSYDILIQLSVPISSTNLNLGMIMINTTLETQDRQVLATSARPALVVQPNWFARAIFPILWTLPHTLGFTTDASNYQKIQLTAFNGYVELENFPMTVAQIRLNHPAFQCYSGEIIVMTQLRGIRYLMYYWWIPTAILAICNLTFFEALALFVVAVGYHSQGQEDESSDVEDDSCNRLDTEKSAAGTRSRRRMMMINQLSSQEKPSSQFMDEEEDGDRTDTATTLFENDHYTLRYRTPTSS